MAVWCPHHIRPVRMHYSPPSVAASLPADVLRKDDQEGLEGPERLHCPSLLCFPVPFPDFLLVVWVFVEWGALLFLSG